MVRRNSRSRKRRRRQHAQNTPEDPSNQRQQKHPTQPSTTMQDADAAKQNASGVSNTRVRIRPWREQMQGALDALRAWARVNYSEPVDTFVASRFGTPPNADHPHDIDRAIDDFLCSLGSAGHERASIAKAFANKAEDLEDTDRTQVARWDRERRRGVFLIQRATRDTLDVWDPLEGAPLSLHLLERIGQARARDLARGTVAVATYMPWVARLVATDRVEFFDASEALPLFRRQVEEEGALWHELPAVVPMRAQKTLAKKVRSSKASASPGRSKRKRS